jgi:thiamine biosynthesis lipoprotein
MKLSRRRFITLSACALATPGAAASRQWRGHAFGSEVSVDLRGDAAHVEADIDLVIDELRRIEARFSLFSPGSELSRLNARGRLAASAELRGVLQLARHVHRATDGLFDPTIQPLWEALAAGGDVVAARALVGFERVDLGAGDVRLAPRQKLSLNGIAQGHAADRVAALLRARGYRKALVDMGEFSAIGGPFRLAIEDPRAGLLGQLTLRGGAIATSSPSAMQIGGQDHIFHPRGGSAHWSTVTVEARSAALADAASTALVLMPLAQVHRAAQVLGLTRVFLVDAAGDLIRL